jgi:tetratricopeptide (TPR) repeat protein
MRKLMKLMAVASALALLAAMCSANGGKKKLTQAERLNVIWDAALARVNMQTDAWFEDGEFPRCIQLLRFQNILEPSDYETATNLGWLLESTEQNHEALATYIRYAKQNPTDPDRFYPEANFYYMKKAYAKVPALMEPTLTFKGSHANCFRILAHSYERMGMLKDSKRVWELYLKRVPTDDAAKNNLKRVEDKLKNPQKQKPVTRSEETAGQ